MKGNGMEMQNQLHRIRGLLLIGGASRNVGKTTLICSIISHFGTKLPIVALKIKTIYPERQDFHGKDHNPLLNEDFRLIEEFNVSGPEDTSEMLRAGAKRSFRLKVKESHLHRAFIHFTNQIDKNSLIVCESNSLRKTALPDLYLLIKNKDDQNMKPSAAELEKYADRIIITDGTMHHFNIENLRIIDSKWQLNND
jgi:hypothetical protein